MDIIVEPTKLAAAITLIAKSSLKLDAKIHTVAVSCLVHIRDHGNTTPLTSLFAALPKGTRLKSIFVWCERFAPLLVSMKKETYGQVKLNANRTPEQYDILNAMAYAPWDLAGHKEEAPALDFVAILKLVTRHVKKSLAKGRITIEEVKALSDRVSAELTS